MNKKLSISVSKEICCCNSCTAKNYPGDGVGKRVDKIYKIVAGQMVIHLCPECLQELDEVKKIICKYENRTIQRTMVYEVEKMPGVVATDEQMLEILGDSDIQLD